MVFRHPKTRSKMEIYGLQNDRFPYRNKAFL